MAEAAVNDELLKSIQHFLISSIRDNKAELGLTINDLHHFAEVILDKASLHRFVMKHQETAKASIDSSTVESLLVAHMDWRITNSIASLRLDSLSKSGLKMLQEGLVTFWKVDKKGRPVIYITPSVYIPDNSIEDLRLCMLFTLEVARKWLHSLNHQSSLNGRNELVTSVVLIVDLKGFGLSNMNYELIPLFLEIFRNHFPRLLGQVLVLNYGWIHSGIWGIIRSAMSAEAASRIRFVTSTELTEWIDAESLSKGSNALS